MHWDDPDNDMDSSSIIFSVVDSPSKGTVTAGVGVLVYNPTDDRAGTDTFTFKVSDGELESNTSTATITIEGVAVTYPNGGESLQVGETHTLTWESSFSNNAIQVYKGGVKVNGGGAGGDINGDAGDVRSYDWTIPSDFTTGNDFKIRIYNPTKNAIEKDKEARFIKKWLPKLKEVPIPLIYEPWKMSEIEQSLFNCKIGKDYPKPIVDISETRKFALEKLWSIRKIKQVKAVSYTHLTLPTSDLV